jgi:amidase
MPGDKKEKPKRHLQKVADKKSWQEIVSEANAYRDESLVEFSSKLPELPNPLPTNVMDMPSKLLTERELWITNLQVDDLLERLSGRCREGQSLSAVEVTTAFLQRSALAQRLVRI